MFVRLAGSHRLRHALSGLAMLGALTLALGTLAPGAQAAAATNADSTTVTLDISQPSANNGVAEGPVGANLAVQGTATAGDTITFGVAPRGAGCTTGSQPLNGVTATVQPDGTFSTSFAWPQIASTVGARYYVCAQDTTTNAVGASQTLFQVDSADPPSITVQQVKDPTAPPPGPGTPTPVAPNPPDGTYYTGGYIEVKGQNFTPGGTQVQILVTQGQLTPATATTPPLQIVKGVAQSSRNGGFDVVAQLPSGQTGQFYISATSSDGTSAVLPTLVASQAAQFALAPTPTPAPTATAAVTPTASVAPTPQNTGHHGPSTGRIVGAIALGLFSAIFFILGVAMLISASGMSSAPPSTRPQMR